MEIDSLSNLLADALLEYGFQRGGLVGTNLSPAGRLLLSSFIDLAIPRF
jgi:hypothetical protein